MSFHPVLLLFATAVVTAKLATAVTLNDVVNKNIEPVDTALSLEDFMAAEEEAGEVNLTRALGIRMKEGSAGKFEGDIARLSSRTIGGYIERSNKLGRNAIRDRWRKWPGAQIPYVLSSQYGSYSKKVIARAMNEYHKRTCVKFVPRDSGKHRDYIYITPDDGCYSLVGRTGGRQPLSLDAGCIQKGTIIHELMHTVGFFHEQSRNDRDDWIEIVWRNVMDEASDQFEKYSLRTISHLGEEYDYSSIMHYGPYAFSRNGRRTIRPRKAGGRRMGQREGFSPKDLKKINKLYRCPEDGEEEEEEEEGGGEERPRPPTEPPTTGKCEDHNWRCYFWSMGLLDYCAKYERVRNEICPKSCGTCSRTSGGDGPRAPTTRRTTPTTTTTTRRPSRPTAVNTNRKKCRDLNPSCTRWADKKYCRKAGYSSFMEKTCPKSCGKCTPSKSRKNLFPSSGMEIARKARPEDSCRDDPDWDTRCRLTKLLGDCNSQRNRARLRRYCKKTCGFCDEED